jgi:hypothetical protein
VTKSHPLFLRLPKFSIYLPKISSKAILKRLKEGLSLMLGARVPEKKNADN